LNSSIRQPASDPRSQTAEPQNNRCDVAASCPHSIFAKRLECCADRSSPPPYAVAVSADGSRAYVTNEGSGTVSVIDTATNSVVSTITVGSLPTVLAISPDGSQIYVDNYSSGTVSVIDPTTNTVKATINVGGDPYGVVFSPDGSRAYVANDVGIVSVINTSTESVIDTINVGEAVGVAISPDGSRLYVSHYKGSNTVSVIDTTTDTVVDSISVGNVPEYMALGAPKPVIFTDNFSPPSTLWSDSVGNWTGGSGKYFAQAPSNGPETISVLPYVFTNSNLSVTVTVNDVSDGGIRLDSDGTQNNGVVFVLGGNGYGGGNRSGGAGNSAYWAVWHNGVSQQSLSEVDGVFTPGGTYTVTVLVNGNTYKAYMDPEGVFDANSTLITTLVDNTFSSGKVGLYDYYSGLSFSNFSVSGFLAPGSAPLVTEVLKNDTGSSPTDKITNDPTLTGSGDPNALVSFTIDGVLVATTTTADGFGNWTFKPTGLADGQHTVIASETDAAGNTGTASLTFMLDGTAPLVTEALKNDTGSSPTDKITKDPTLTGSGDANAVVSFTVDGTPIATTVTANGNGNWVFTPTGLADGQHTVIASETDAAGNAGPASLTFMLDSTAPVVTEALKNDTGSSPTDKITSDPTVMGSGDPNATVHFTVDGGAIASTVAADGNGHWTFADTGLLDGTHTIVASETDIAGNAGTTSLTFTLDTTPPVPSITSEVLMNGKVTLTGTTAEANDAISVYDGSNLLGTVTTDSNDNWKFVTGTVSNTVHVYTVSATDLAGNVGQGTNEAILGSTKADALVGGPGNDVIVGNGGNDTFTGGGGADTLFAGAGNDTFVFKAITDSTPTSHDTIFNFNHSNDVIEFNGISGINGSHGVPTFQGNLTGSGNLVLNAHSVGYVEVGGNTEVLVNTTSSAESVTLSDTHAANMEIVLSGIHLGLTSHDFHLI